MAYSKARNLATWCQENHIDLTVAIEIKRIEREAVARGWSLRRLWEAKFFPVDQQGLAAIMDPGDRIVEVAHDWIGIQKPEPPTLRFWREPAPKPDPNLVGIVVIGTFADDNGGGVRAVVRRQHLPEDGGCVVT